MNKYLRIIVPILATGVIILDFYSSILPINLSRSFVLIIILGLIGLSIFISFRQTEYEDLKETYLYQRITTIYVVALVIILNIVFPVSTESFFRISHPVFWMLVLLSFTDAYKTKQRLNKYDSENIKT